MKLNNFFNAHSKQTVKEDIDSNSFKEILKVFLPIAKKVIKLDKMPAIILKKQLSDGEQPTMGRFHNDKYILELAIANRHPVDVLRTLAHELVHAKQNRDHVNIDPATGSPEENEANALAGIVMRHFNKLHPEYLKTEPISEGGNLAVGDVQAQQIDLKVHDRKFIVPILDQLLQSINNSFAKSYNTPLWSPQLLKSRKFLSGSSLHFFDTDIPDEEFVKRKPKVGDIDTQVNKESEGALEQFLTSVQGKTLGTAKLVGFQRGNEQFSSLWELQDPPIKVQIDLEFVAFEKDEPTGWSQFSHSSSWDDLAQGIKGVFHKYMMRALTANSATEKYVARQLKKGVKISDEPVVDNNLSFAVSSKQGGGMRSKYVPYNDPETGKPMMKNGIPVMLQVASGDSEYIQDLEKQYSLLFGRQPTPQDAKQMWSYVGLIQLANKFLQPEQRQAVADAFVEMLFGPGSQGLYKGDPKRDQEEKMVALNTLVKGLQGVNGQGVLSKAQADSKDYYAKYKVIDESLNEAEVKSQLRKGMPHLRDLKPADLLDLIDEIHDGNGNFKLQNIPLNVKVDGFGGRFGKNAEGKPFMGTSRTEPRYEAGFAAYHQKKGTTDPEVLGRAQLFDKLFEEMMKAVKMVDSKLGPDFLINKQVTCEVLFLPFATRTDSGRLKFVGIEYDELPTGVDLALVPFRVVNAESGEDLPNSDKVIKALTSLGKQGSVMFIDNSLTQNEALDVTAIVPPLENIEQIKSLLASGKLAGKREAKEVLAPIALALEKAIINDPNIVGKDMLGKDYEGIVLNTRLGPVKVTSQEQKDVIAAKNAAKQSARTERPRGEAKTAVVAVGSFVGHVGHEQLFDYTVKKAKAVGGDPYLFMGNAVGKDDPIPVQTKLETWHKLYPEYADNISAVTQQGGTLMQKIKHELINPLPGKPPRYDNVIIMVGEDQAGMNIAQALMKAVNKFQGYEHVKVSLEATPRGTGMSFTKLRNILKDPNATEQEQFAVWANAFDVKKLGADWIKNLMDVTRKGMGIQNTTAPKQKAGRVLNTLVAPKQTPVPQDTPDQVNELDLHKGNSYMGRLTMLAHKIKNGDQLRPQEYEEYRNLMKQYAADKAKKTMSQEDVAAKLNPINWLNYGLDKAQGPKSDEKAFQKFNGNDTYIDAFDDERDIETDKEVKEAPIEMDPADPMDPMIHSHDKANPAKLKYRMSRAAGQLKDLAQRSQNASPIEWETITRQFQELTMNIEQIRHALEELGKVRKKGGIKSRGIDPHIGESSGKKKGVDGKACWKGYKYAGKVKKADGTYKDKCVPIGEGWEQVMSTAVNKLLENFADGKKPGRKGLAKRSGVNTKASVSDLRKTAKNSTGEKARMAHWMANMKAGKAKK